MVIGIVRLFFVALCMLFGYRLSTQFIGLDEVLKLAGAAAGLVVAVVIITVDLILKKTSVKSLSCIMIGLFFGLIMANLIMTLFALIPFSDIVRTGVHLGMALSLSYLGVIVALHNQDEFNLIIPYVKFSRQNHREGLIILDTSVIIDGRIADICETRFVEGKFIIPRFVLKELQAIADSSDGLKRNRGRRGLDVLNKIQKNTNIDVKIHETDLPEISEVDGKLVKLAMILNARIFTNDYNLNKVAEIQGVPTLNINELANALKPIVLPGEVMEAKIIREGKEHGQGVAYLNDGTMVVVDNARSKIGQVQKVVVTSVLQTQAGRMIFAKLEA
ncbi:MAG: TRAM domain-containing protein [Candidatus Omnitrophota bacterium]|nr:TRAM domain-containing protein [Candidatus Omnitrophota bacterium]